MQLNHLICPHCGHDCHVDETWARCAACGCCFYAYESLPVVAPAVRLFEDPTAALMRAVILRR
jgi:hypothetical protein